MAENSGDDVGATLVAHAPAPVGANARNRRAEMTRHQRRGPPRSTTSWLVSGRTRRTSRARSVSELTALIDSNTIRVLDLVMITRADDRSVEATEMREADDSEIGESRALERDRDPARRGGHQGESAQSLVPDVGGAVRPAVRRSGAERLGSGRIPTQALIRIGRSRPPSRVERSMKMGPFRNRGDRPRLPRGGHERRAGQRDDRGDGREDRRDDRGRQAG